MLPINVNPAAQGFPLAPDGGTIVASPVQTLPPNNQAFAPAPLVNLFPTEPTAPLVPVRPASVGQPVLPVKFELVPQALAVDPAGQILQPLEVPNYVVADSGNYVTNANAIASLANYVVSSVLDSATGLPPNSATVNLLVNLVPNGKTLPSYGVSLAGRTAEFDVVQTSATRTISANGTNDITVPNAGFIPVTGDTAFLGGNLYNVVSVVDALTNLFPTPASLNLKVALDNSVAFPPGTLIGQTVVFTVTVDEAESQILIYSNFALVTPVKDNDGNFFLPVAGDVVAIDIGRYDAELVSQLTGQVQDVIPSTQPVLPGFAAPAGSFPIIVPNDGTESSGLPVPDFVVNEQVLTHGTPVDYTPGISELNRSAQEQNVIVGQKTDTYKLPANLTSGIANFTDGPIQGNVIVGQTSNVLGLPVDIFPGRSQ